MRSLFRSLAAACLAVLAVAAAFVNVSPPAVAGAAQPVDAAAKPKVLLVGDSVFEMLCEYLPAELDELRRTYDVTCEGLDKPPYHFTSDGPALIRAHAGHFTDHLVIGLGYNDGSDASAFRQRAEAVMAMPEVQAVRHVYWVTMRDVNGRYAGANAVLRELDARYANLTLLDWHAASAADPRQMTISDGVHLTAAGADAMANLITAALLKAVPTTDPKARCSAPSPGVRSAPDIRSGRGYYLLDSTGRVHGFGSAPLYGDARSTGQPAVSMETTRSGNGYWIVTADGRVHPFGDARSHGDMTGTPLNGPVLRLEAHPRGDGYWLVASDGGVFTFGAASFMGSMGGRRLNAPVLSMSSSPGGDGYWLVAGDGGVFTFGRSRFMGSTGDLRLNAPVIDMAVHPDGRGYWLYARDGGVFTFGANAFQGSVPGMGLCRLPVTVAMRPTATGNGYWIVTSRGWVIPFGDAYDHGGEPTLAPGAGVVDIAVRR